ncbi:aminotransferase class III-fold pyridoxal phosphate-dependent enzyme [Methanobacterium formicicum]|uniref:Glutamate-1-semialdehyde 2,1-aminomutase n=1 Tax=Methanobacterium formicicum (strain DSM 3637 / PP1) TaxID=1204725 RepID=K2RTC5_METFP|nr:aminotransferase class III-fold pyridoxal phosphate-dependent enzyme [Methanobacterium formicicum]EKF86035.1 class III aminotransferase [Methanobacterium formicicum DSM 3637]
MNTGVELWNRAKMIIPGGNQLLSKRSDQFLPDHWPSYYKKAKGVEVWDLDNNHYIDMSIMGIGACTLGYADEEVDKAVHRAIKNGSMCTLNCYEEVELAEMLLEIEPWADMVRYARTGGESAAIAIRIARAATKRDKVAFCGYHGWHDWYLSANITSNENLNDHLLPGLSPLGVPQNLRGTMFPFNYNQIDELESIVEEHGYDLAAIIMEPVRNYHPDDSFLKRVREIANSSGAVLIFDEITTGWRLTVGGAHNIYNVEPDMLIFGKAMGNGYPTGAIIGKREIMESAQDTFISSTFWTERIGPTASIATINKIKETNSPKHLIKIGEYINKGWKVCADNNELDIEIVGVPPLTTCLFQYPEDTALELQTLFTQEMLERGYLAWNHVYTCYKHTEEIVDQYMEHVDDVFGLMADGVKQGNLKNLLKGPVATKGFKRLN